MERKKEVRDKVREDERFGVGVEIRGEEGQSLVQ